MHPNQRSSRPPTEADALCCVCKDTQRPVDLTKLCAAWPSGAVAHLECANVQHFTAVQPAGAA